MEIIDGPKIVSQPEIHYVGLRVITPFRGMLAVRDKLMAELHERGLTEAGPTFHRLNVIDMNGDMDMEVGVVVEPHQGEAALPAGSYATLTYVNHARRANKLLLDWADDNGHGLDRWDDPAGDRFGCRYEAFLTDPRTQRRKTTWRVQLNIRLADAQ
ncbi:hypothetical protein V1227_13045 [Lentzea sp. DG1S-22]|uniref:hypothetical protein n=1 Tax=Lentzea sp. DG1S-22 TaxID=3108822 RepID=UPI002E77C7EA|nr:hypothetical protein [Lentzea sp. DG1S-22]WVH83632.1 hypothetical protein V1227_13045 [Lentzea sp. DG1S-22]